MSSRYINRITFVSVLLASAFYIIPDSADAAKRVYSPYVEQGEWEIETYGTYARDDDSGVGGELSQKFAAGYGVNQFWFTELVFEGEKEGTSDSSHKWESVEWENRFQLTEQGKYWLDAGLYAAYEHALHDGDPEKLELKLLLGKDIGKVTTYVNLNTEQQFGQNSENHPELGIAISSRYRLNQWVEPGLELHSEFGYTDDFGSFDEQEHLLGPVFYGNLTPKLHYEMGYLFGLSDSSPDGEVKWLLEYGWRF